MINKPTFNRFIFLFALYFLGLGGSVFLGQISCQDKSSGCDEEKWTEEKGECVCNEANGYIDDGSGECECDTGYVDDGTGTCDPTTETAAAIAAATTCAEFLADYDYVSGISECICVGAGDTTSWCPQGDSTPASTYTTITSALSSLTSGHSSVAILLAEETFEETLSLTNSNYSNTYFIGIGDSPSDTTISYPSSSTPAVDSNLIKIDSTVSNIGIYNLTLNGIKTEAGSFTSDQKSSDDNLNAATMFITDATVDLQDINFTDNYYRGLYSTGTVTVEMIDFTDFTSGEGDTFGTTIAVWNEGSMTSTDYAFTIQDSTIDVGIVGSEPGHSFSIDGYLSDDVQVASMILRDSDSVTLSQITINNYGVPNPLGIYSEDVETFTWNGVAIAGAYSTLSDATFGLVGCQTDESASTSNSVYTFDGHTSGSLENLYFGTVKVTGSSNSDSSFDNIYTTSNTYVTSDFSGDVTIDHDEGNSYDCSLGTYAP